MKQEITYLLEKAKEEINSFTFESSPEESKAKFLYFNQWYKQNEHVALEILEYTPNYNYLKAVNQNPLRFQIADPKFEMIDYSCAEEELNRLAYQLKLPHNAPILCHYFGPIQYGWTADGEHLELSLFSLEKEGRHRYFIDGKEYKVNEFLMLLSSHQSIHFIYDFFKKKIQYEILDKTLPINNIAKKLTKI